MNINIFYLKAREKKGPEMSKKTHRYRRLLVPSPFPFSFFFSRFFTTVWVYASDNSTFGRRKPSTSLMYTRIIPQVEFEIFSDLFPPLSFLWSLLNLIIRIFSSLFSQQQHMSLSVVWEIGKMDYFNLAIALQWWWYEWNQLFCRGCSTLTRQNYARGFSYFP